MWCFFFSHRQWESPTYTTFCTWKVQGRGWILRIHKVRASFSTVTPSSSISLVFWTKILLLFKCQMPSPYVESEEFHLKLAFSERISQTFLKWLAPLSSGVFRLKIGKLKPGLMRATLLGFANTERSLHSEKIVTKKCTLVTQTNTETQVQKYKSTNPFQNQSISAFLDDSATL